MVSRKTHVVLQYNAAMAVLYPALALQLESSMTNLQPTAQEARVILDSITVLPNGMARLISIPDVTIHYTDGCPFEQATGLPPGLLSLS